MCRIGNTLVVMRTTPTYGMSVETPEENRQLGKSSHRSVANIKVDLKAIGCKDINRIRMSWDMVKSRAVVGAEMELSFEFRKRMGTS